MGPLESKAEIRFMSEASGHGGLVSSRADIPVKKHKPPMTEIESIYELFCNSCFNIVHVEPTNCAALDDKIIPYRNKLVRLALFLILCMCIINCAYNKY